MLCVAVAAAGDTPKSPAEQIASATTAVRTAVIDVLAVLIVLAFVVSVAREMRRRSIVIEPIAVPEQLAKEGYTPQVIAERIRSAIAALRRAARIQGPDEGYELSATLIDFTVPAAGVSYRSALRYIRQVFGHPEERISGEIVMESADGQTERRMRMFLRTRDGQVTFSDLTRDTPIPKLIEQAAHDILLLTDPHTVATYWLAVEQRLGTFHTTIEIVRRCLTKGSEARAYHIWGNALLFSGEFEQAEEKYRQAAEFEPYRAAVYVAWGNVLRQQRRYQDAEAAYHVVLAIDSRNEAAWNNIGQALMDQRQYGEALRCFRRAADLKPRYAYAWNGWGQALTRIGRLDEAEKKLTRAIDLDPSIGWPQLNLAHLRRAQGRPEEAIAALRPATEITETRVDAFLLWADILTDQHELVSAAAMYEKAHQANPKRGIDHLGRAILARRQRLWIESVREAELTIAVNRYNMTAWLLAGDGLRRMRRFAEAEAVYQKARGIDPFLPSTLIGLGHSLRARYRYEDAIRTFQEATAVDPYERSGLRGWAATLLDCHRPDEAIAKLRHAVALWDTDTAAWSDWAQAHIVRGEFAEARERARRSCDVETVHEPGAWRRLADAMLELGIDDGLQALDEGLAKWPWSAELALHKAGIFRTYERTAEAIAAYDRVFDLDSRYADAFASAATLLSDHGLLPQALSIAKHSVSLEPSSDFATVTLGSLLFQTGDIANGEACLARLPDSTRTLIQYGASLANAGRRDEALQKFEIAAAIDRQNAEVHVRVAHLRKEPDRFRRATEINPYYAWAWRSWGDSLRTEKKAADAESKYRTAVQLDRRDIYATLGASRAAADLADDQRARRLLEAAIANARTPTDFRWIVDRLFEIAEKNLALDVIDRALDRGFRPAGLLREKARVLHALERFADEADVKAEAASIRDEEMAALGRWAERLLAFLPEPT